MIRINEIEIYSLRICCICYNKIKTLSDLIFLNNDKEFCCMSTKSKLIGFTLATTAAVIFTNAHAFREQIIDDRCPCIFSPGKCPCAIDTKDKEICYGSNSCRGRGQCKTAIASCRGQNICRGVGITYEYTEHDCLNAGGTRKIY